MTDLPIFCYFADGIRYDMHNVLKLKIKPHLEGKLQTILLLLNTILFLLLQPVLDIGLSVSLPLLPILC